jgi:hypothetical protein
MRRAVLIFGIALCLGGVYLSASTYLFLTRAVQVEAEVVAVETRQGPPKPRSKTPLHVRYRLSDGHEHLSKTSMPLLQRVEVGDRVHVLVDSLNPEVIRLPLLSVLWATPITLCVVGVALVAASRCALSKPAAQHPLEHNHGHRA